MLTSRVLTFLSWSLFACLLRWPPDFVQPSLPRHSSWHFPIAPQINICFLIPISPTNELHPRLWTIAVYSLLHSTCGLCRGTYRDNLQVVAADCNNKSLSNLNCIGSICETFESVINARVGLGFGGKPRKPYWPEARSLKGIPSPPIFHYTEPRVLLSFVCSLRLRGTQHAWDPLFWDDLTIVN